MPFEIKLSRGRRHRRGICFWIKEQNFRDGEWNHLKFGLHEGDGEWWMASNGWGLSSQCFPQVKQSDKNFFLRGDRPTKDKNLLYASPASWRQIKEAVAEFNRWSKTPDLSLEDEFFKRTNGCQ